RMPDSAAANIGQPWTDLHALAGDAAPGRNRLAGACLAELLPALERFDREGLLPFLERYAALDALAGRQVQVHGGDGVREGTAGIAADGALRVRIDGAERAGHAGEVSVRSGGVAPWAAGCSTWATPASRPRRWKRRAASARCWRSDTTARASLRAGKPSCRRASGRRPWPAWSRHHCAHRCWTPWPRAAGGSRWRARCRAATA